MLKQFRPWVRGVLDATIKGYVTRLVRERLTEDSAEPSARESRLVREIDTLKEQLAVIEHRLDEDATAGLGGK